MHGAALGNVKCLLFLSPVVLKLPPACGSLIWGKGHLDPPTIIWMPLVKCDSRPSRLRAGDQLFTTSNGRYLGGRCHRRIGLRAPPRNHGSDPARRWHCLFRSVGGARWVCVAFCEVRAGVRVLGWASSVSRINTVLVRNV